jgi:hypothetical protein
MGRSGKNYCRDPPQATEIPCAPQLSGIGNSLYNGIAGSLCCNRYSGNYVGLRFDKLKFLDRHNRKERI